MGGIRVRAITTFPTRGEPGVAHSHRELTHGGLVGDRPKKAALSLVGADSPTTRANLVLDAPTGDVESLAGATVRVGEATLVLRLTGTDCPGLYASVDRGGVVQVGDRLEVTGRPSGDGPT